MLVEDAEQLWTASAELLRAQVSEAVWLTSFQDAQPVGIADGRLVLAVPSSLVKERIEGRYLALVRDALAEVGFPGVELRIEVRTDAGDLSVRAPEPSSATTAPGARTGTAERSTDGLVARYTFENFVTGTSNRFAHAAALAVAETPARSYNPLFVYGAAGLGKTHLLHAIGHYVDQNYPQYTVRYVSTETFLNEFVDAIRTNTTQAFKRRYREVDVLMIDDIQFMENKEGLQEEFFHTFNSLHGADKQIVISSDRQPDSIPTLEDRLRSRFKWGLITDIQPPDLETRLAILRKKAEREPTPVPDEVLEFIATHITDNIRELEGALIRVTAYASLNKTPLSTALAERVLSDLLTGNQPRPVTPDRILSTTSDMFGFSVEELRGKSRRRPLVTARQVGMYVFRELTDLSYPAIAREFGGRDHTTVIHAVEKISGLMKERRQTYDQVTELIQRIKAAG
ncbi:MAG: chromosomal replication initiator protein DnaA [Acidimicrobiales bacterium]|nr:chromosomal replication initiator protein DnaA [Acidimicrobiales bacterium]